MPCRQQGHLATAFHLRPMGINSFAAGAKFFAHAVHNHWGIENKQHWRLDVVFREDDNRIRKGHATIILTTISHIYLNLLQKEPPKISIKKK